ncbi:MAG: heavy metal translocating P-type ATPase, partial [Spirochaetia bacterium]|nr:heavy metal translocating P-type ATPase [Spirochaetia bacterium]
YYTPVVVVFALLLALLPPLIDGDWSNWFYRSLVFLVVSCPCALVVSVPLTYFGALGRSAKEGILIKGGNFLDAVHKADTILFDKTGTLTTGNFKVERVQLIGNHPYEEEYLLRMVSALERQSNHPLARAFAAYETSCRVTSSEEIAGKGLIGIVDGKTIAVGNTKLFDQLNIKAEVAAADDRALLLAIEGSTVAAFFLKDTIKEDALSTIKKLRKKGIQHQIIISGDYLNTVKDVAQELNLDAYHAQLLPQEKFELLRSIAKEHPNLIYVGDGINDGPSLAASKVGIALGRQSTDVARENSDIVIASDKLSKLYRVKIISDKATRLATQNIVLALTVKSLVMLGTVFGYTSMWLAVLADTGVTIIAIFNALRIKTSPPVYLSPNFKLGFAFKSKPSRTPAKYS